MNILDIITKNRITRAAQAVISNMFPGKNEERSHAHWSKLANHGAEWDERVFQISKLLISADRTVFEFGAGRLALKNLLPVSTKYFNHDLVSRDETTFVFNLNERPIPEIPSADVAVFSGVLEYIYDVETFLPVVAKKFTSIVASYVTRERGGTLRHRHEMGWQNHFEETQLIHIFERFNFKVVRREEWSHNQVLYRFDRH